MSAPVPGVATRIFASLQAVGCEVTAVELAEILWLAPYVPPARQAESGSPSRQASLKAPVPPPLGTDPALKVSSDALPPSPPDRDRHAQEGLYARVERDTRLARGRRASLVRAPGAPALPNALALSRALRPLLKKRVSRHRWQLDEEATAEATALNHGLATPVFTPSAERWFDVALVVDDTPSMHVWHQAAGELRRLLTRHGGFRDLRQYRLRAEGSDVELISESGRRLKPNAISDPSGRRLVVLLSDVVSAMWRAMPLRQELFSWARWSPVVMVDVLPRRMWPHTSIGFAERAMSPRRAAAPNVEWLMERDWWDAADAVDASEAVESPGGRRGRGAAGRRGITLPVISLDADQFGRWARAVMQVSAERCTGTLLHVEDVTAPAGEPEASESMTALERVQHFRSAASEPAYQLACYFAATLPVLPVLRIVQRQMMPWTGPSHLAEFLLSGLVRPRPDGLGTAADTNANGADREGARRVDPERIVYEFYPGVQDLLLAQLDAQEVPRIMPAIEAYLKAHLGESYDLLAMIPDGRGVEEISAEARPFVKPAFDLMQRIMGRRPRAAASIVFERLVRILQSAFPNVNIRALVEDAIGLPDDEVRTRLIAAALQLMPDEQRETLLPLAMTLPSPNLPARLWRALFTRKALEPLDRMDAIVVSEDNSLAVTADVRELLRQYVGPIRMPAMQRRIIEAYLGSGDQGEPPDLPSFADAYFYRHILTHVARAEYDDLVRSIVGSPDWIEGKYRVCGLAELLADLDRFSHIPAIRELREIVARRVKEQESTQGWAESVIEEWLSTLPEADTDALTTDLPPRVWVLVAGTGTRTLTDFERKITFALGKRLAAEGHGLICGEWRGVDTVVADGYIHEMGRASEPRLVRIPSTNWGANLESARTELLPDWALAQADAVVLIGGAGQTLAVGHEAIERFVPVIPVAATGGDAARMFQEMVADGVYMQDDPLAAPGSAEESVEPIVDRIVQLLDGAEPSNQVLSLAGTYLRTTDVARAESIDARLLTILGRLGVTIDWPLVNPPLLRACLAAFAYRVTPDPAVTHTLFEPDDSPHVVLQRVRACEAAFESREARASLPRDAENLLSRLYSTLDETRDDITRLAKQFMAGRLLPLARLVAIAEVAASPGFDELSRRRLVTAAVVHRHMALDCLADPHPGWRLIGLAAFTSPALHLPRPVADIASRILRACRFEATFHSHLRLAVEAIDLMIQRSLPLNLDQSERETLERIRQQI